MGRKYQSGPQLSIHLSHPAVRSSLEIQNVNPKYKTIAALDLGQKLHRSSPIVHNITLQLVSLTITSPCSVVSQLLSCFLLQTSQPEFSYWNYAQAQTRQQQCSRHHTSCCYPALTDTTLLCSTHNIFLCTVSGSKTDLLQNACGKLCRLELCGLKRLLQCEMRRYWHHDTSSDEYNQKLFISAAKVLDCSQLWTKFKQNIIFNFIQIFRTHF